MADAIQISKFRADANMLVTGPDSNLWFAAPYRIGRITTAGEITEFPLPTASAEDITVGPDGNLWFTEIAFVPNGGRIGRITPQGLITEFPIPTPGGLGYPSGITTGPDGNLWFTERQGNTPKIGRITPDGQITEFSVPTPNSGPTSITTGPDGNLWFIEWFANKIGRITPAGVITEFPVPTPCSPFCFGPVMITTGSDGNLWFTRPVGNIARITPAGEITEFPLPAGGAPFAITRGPDGNLWFTGNDAGGGKIGRVTLAGEITEFRVPVRGAADITVGPDGNLWFTVRYQRTGERRKGMIGRITPAGVITEFPLNSIGFTPAGFSATGSFPTGIMTGPHGNLWFIDQDQDQIERISPTALLNLSPPSGIYVMTQRFDLAMILGPGVAVAAGQAVLDGADVTGPIVNCAILGTLLSGGQTLRCPDGPGTTLNPGTHAFGVVLELADGMDLVAGVTWAILANSEQ